MSSPNDPLPPEDSSDNAAPYSSFVKSVKNHAIETQQFFTRSGMKNVLLIALLLIIVTLFWQAVYTVPSDSVAVVQRFGKFHLEIQPGLHFKFPLGIDKATIVPVKRQLKQEFGFTTPGARDPFQGSMEADGELETQMVTGDLNAALVEWVVQ
ncbi:SPFH domain-containing protein, partial [Shewanella sp. 0m-11]